ncbi:MAG: PA0069 family radical SAM protein [Thermoanaerobaculia bacterium]|jgi:DNA repair photolyase
MHRRPPNGRGASINPVGRFESIEYVTDENVDVPPEDTVAEATRFFRDPSRSIIASNDSPDVAFDRSINPYRGCEHGCIYCYARPTHEYLGYSAGLDFETKIMVKEDALALLRKELSAKGWTPQVIGLSGVTDCYQPVERTAKLTRGCLEVLAEFRNPVFIVTKNHLVTRDIDLLSELARWSCVSVHISVTTLDDGLARAMEPRASAPQRRLDAIAELTAAGIPVCVLTAPIIPGLNDHEVPAILGEAARRGASNASYTVLRLPYAVKDLFTRWLEEVVPDRKEKVLNRIREMRDGELNTTAFGARMKATGVFADQLRALFDVSCRREGLARGWPELTVEHFRRPEEPRAQLTLF